MFDRIVILTGAGLSAESGLGTFRDKGGLWEEFDLEEVATPEGFARNPAACTNSTISAARRLGDARPNAAHHGAGPAGEGARRPRPHRDAEHRRPARSGPARTS